MLELSVLVLFILAGYSAALLWSLMQRWQDRRQQRVADEMTRASYGTDITRLIHELGDPFEIERGTTGRELYIWKFPPSTTLPKGTGLLVLTVTTDKGVVTEHVSKRHRQL